MATNVINNDPGLTPPSLEAVLKQARGLNPLLVVGVPRSGTSMTAHAVKQSGVWMGSQPYNYPDGPTRGGYCEDEQMKRLTTKRILPMCDYPEHGMVTSMPHPIRVPVQLPLAPLPRRSWGMKGCANLLMWPMWEDICVPFWLIVRRPDRFILRSLERSVLPRPLVGNYSDVIATYKQRIDEVKEGVPKERWAEYWPLEKEE